MILVIIQLIVTDSTMREDDRQKLWWNNTEQKRLCGIGLSVLDHNQVFHSFSARVFCFSLNGAKTKIWLGDYSTPKNIFKLSQWKKFNESENE